MHQLPSNIPVIMTFSCSDPTGGGGIQADIQTLFSLGCHCATVITAITARDTCELKDYMPTPPSLVIEQARTVLEDIPIAAFKIGFLGSVENAVAIHTLLTDYPNIPVIFNPVVDAIGRTTDQRMISVILSLLCPMTTVLTPDNTIAQLLIPEAKNIEECAEKIMQSGCQYVLITNTHTTKPTIDNLFFGHHRLLQIYSWERLPKKYHGCGCTLSAAIAGLIAHKVEISAAIHDAQEYTCNCLKQALRMGMGLELPNRLFWLQSMDENKDNS